MGSITERSKPKVSVIMPTYNGGRYILDAVRSALAQTYQPVEIIVIDDGSTEDMSKVLAPVAEKIRYVRQENAGPAAARNYGIRLAIGDYIAFLDHDDLWCPTSLEKRMKVFEENPDYWLVYCYPGIIDEDGQEIPNEAPGFFPQGDVFLAFLRRNRISCTSAAMVKKSVLEAIGGFDEAVFCEDYDLWLRITHKYEAGFCDGMLLYYRVHQSNLSRNFDIMLQSHVEVVEKYAKDSHVCARYGARKVKEALRCNKYDIYNNYAYRYYYGHGDRDKAKNLLFKCMGLSPIKKKDLLYFVLFSLPQPIFDALRRFKSKIISHAT